MTVKSKQLQETIAAVAEESMLANQRSTSQPIAQQIAAKPAYSASPNKVGKGSPQRRPMAGMIQSTLDSSRKSRPTSSLRTTEDFSQFSNMASASYSSKFI